MTQSPVIHKYLYEGWVTVVSLTKHLLSFGHGHFVQEEGVQWAGGRPFCFFARARRVGVEIFSSKTGWAWVGARARPALSEVLANGAVDFIWLQPVFTCASAEVNINTSACGKSLGGDYSELELELIQTQMTQKPMLRAEVYARALRASQNRKEDSV